MYISKLRLFNKCIIIFESVVEYFTIGDEDIGKFTEKIEDGYIWKSGTV